MTRKTDSVTDIDVKTLRSVYNIPIEQAAKQLGVCVTVLKRICRRKGIARWPYRKLKSINKMIDSIEEYSADQGEPGKVSSHLEKLKVMRDSILQSPSSDDDCEEDCSPVSTARNSTQVSEGGSLFRGAFSSDKAVKLPSMIPSSVYTSAVSPVSDQHMMNRSRETSPTAPDASTRSFKFVSSPYESEVNFQTRKAVPPSISSQFVKFEHTPHPASYPPVKVNNQNLSNHKFPPVMTPVPNSPLSEYSVPITLPQTERDYRSDDKSPPSLPSFSQFLSETGIQ